MYWNKLEWVDLKSINCNKIPFEHHHSSFVLKMSIWPMVGLAIQK